MAKRSKKSRSLGALSPEALRAFAVSSAEGAIGFAQSSLNNAKKAADAGKCKTALSQFSNAEYEYGRYIGLSTMEDAVNRKFYREAEKFSDGKRDLHELMGKECLAPWALSGAPKRKTRKPRRKSRR